MSIVVKKIDQRDLAHVVKVEDDYYYIDSANTWDKGFETMAFWCDSEGKVTSWRDVACEHYATAEEMEKGHMHMIEHLEDYLE